MGDIHYNIFPLTGVGMKQAKSHVWPKPWPDSGIYIFNVSLRSRATRTYLIRSSNNVFNLQLYFLCQVHNCAIKEEEGTLFMMNKTTESLQQLISMICITILMIPPSLIIYWFTFPSFYHPSIFLWHRQKNPGIFFSWALSTIPRQQIYFWYFFKYFNFVWVPAYKRPKTGPKSTIQ